MDPLHAIVLGALQGVTEFLPISSSGHLLVVPALFGWEAQGIVFDVTVHLATLLAICIGLRREISSVVKGIREGTKADRTLVLKLLVATVPAAFVGFVFSDLLDSARVVPVVAAMLIVWGVLLLLADYLPRKKNVDARRVHDVTWKQAAVIGVTQAFALIPGTSRSGATMTAGLFAGLDRAQAVRFSFLLAIPAILGAGTKTVIDVVQAETIDVPVASLVLGFISAFVFGVMAIRLLFFIINKSGFVPFALYRIAFGILLFVLLAQGVIVS